MGAAYLCARCGSFLCTECTVIAEDAESYCVGCEVQMPGLIPWEQRGRIGRLPAFVRTTGAVLLAPAQFFQQTPRERAIWPTLLFGYLFTLVVDAVDLVRAVVVWRTDPGYRDAFMDGFRQGSAHLPQLGEYADWAWALTEFGGPLGSPAWYALWLLILGASWWLGLRVVAGPVSFPEVLRALSYTNVLAGFGLLTMWFTGPAIMFSTISLLLWSGVLQILAMSRLVGNELGRAVGAFLLMLLLLSLGSCAACIAPAMFLGALG